VLVLVDDRGRGMAFDDLAEYACFSQALGLRQ
jgi:hypothetical protein